VEKYGRAGQARDGNIIRRMRIACWITKATDRQTDRQAGRQARARAHAQNIRYLLLLRGNNAYTNASQCYVIRTSRLLLLIIYLLLYNQVYLLIRRLTNYLSFS
jgi:hypothetical protein